MSATAANMSEDEKREGLTAHFRAAVTDHEDVMAECTSSYLRVPVSWRPGGMKVETADKLQVFRCAGCTILLLPTCSTSTKLSSSPGHPVFEKECLR